MSALLDTPVSLRIKLAGLWTSLMFCYIYCDYFELYTPGKLDGMLQGKMGPLGEVNQSILLGTALMMLIPSLMILLSLIIPAGICRWLNIGFGAAYTILLALLAVVSTWWFYQGFAAIEALLSAYAVWLAWRWPRSLA